MQVVVTREIMRESDRNTVAQGVSAKVLIERAAKAIRRSYAFSGPTAIVCGEGNNGADGFALALLLHEEGIPCRLVRLSETVGKDGESFLELCRKERIPESVWEESDGFSRDGEIVDCIYGTGFHGVLNERAGRLIFAMNQSGKPIVSADINSGLDSDNGLSGGCVRSALTVSLGNYKSGHFLGDAKDVIKSLCNADIGIPIVGKKRFLAEPEDLADILPQRKQNSHKGDYGYVTVMGGCREYAGAVKLANLACSALRAGAGVAALAVPESIAGAVAPFLLESTLLCLPECGSVTKDGQWESFRQAVARQKAVAVGMGWGKHPIHRGILSYLLQSYTGTLIIDADGLNELSAMGSIGKELLGNAVCKTVLTPHAKELERLSGIPVKEILQNPVGVAEAFAAERHTVLLLKGACTVITDGSETYLVNRGCPGMATAGSGDVLSGILAGVSGYLPASPKSIAAGAMIAGLAGERAERKVGSISMLSSDTVQAISEVLAEELKNG